MRCRWPIVALVLCLAWPLQADEPKKAPAKVFQVPYRLTGASHILVRAKINGKGPFNFIIDTGAPGLFVTTEVGKKLDLTADKGKAILDRFEVEGGAAQTKVGCFVETPFQLQGMNSLGLAGTELHGIIGYTYLAHYKMELDFTRDKMTWKQLDFQPPPPARLLGEGAAANPLGGLGGLGALKLLNPGVKKQEPPPPLLRGFLGLELAEMGGSVKVKSVLAKSPAASAGLQAGDRIRQVQGSDVSSFADVHRALTKLAAGQSVRIAITRGDEQKEITVTAGEGL
jgi:hypothetical protein